MGLDTARRDAGAALEGFGDDDGRRSLRLLLMFKPVFKKPAAKAQRTGLCVSAVLCVLRVFAADVYSVSR
jgi:hypothetical protein